MRGRDRSRCLWAQREGEGEVWRGAGGGSVDTRQGRPDGAAGGEKEEDYLSTCWPREEGERESANRTPTEDGWGPIISLCHRQGSILRDDLIQSYSGRRLFRETILLVEILFWKSERDRRLEAGTPPTELSLPSPRQRPPSAHAP